MRTKSFWSLGILLLTSGPAWAEAEYSADANLGLRLTRGEEESARFMEYRDLTTGVISGADFDYFNAGTHAAGSVRNVGRDDQSYLLSGGRYYQYRYRLGYDFLPHNLSFGSRTFYTAGVGTGEISYPTGTEGTGFAPSPNIIDSNVRDVQGWRSVEYSLQRKKLFGGLEVSLDSPFFLNVTANRTTLEGIRPSLTTGGIYSRSGGLPTSIFFEFPEPVDQGTTTVEVEGGYKSGTIYASATGELSKFATELRFLTFRNPFATGGGVDLRDKYSLSPDSDLKRLSLQTTVYRLPLDSTLQLKGSTENITNSIVLEKTLSMSDEEHNEDTNTINTVTLNRDVFEGDLSHKNASAVWSARPLSPLTMELYYRYLIRENHNTEILYDGDARNPRHAYRKNNGGAELGYKLPARTKLRSGYDYAAVVRRERIDGIATFDKTLFAELKNSYFDLVGAKVKYSYLRRTSEFGNAAASGLTALTRRFDVTDQRRNAVKASVDVTPLRDLDLGVGYTWRRSVYDKTVIGLLDAVADEWNFDVTYRWPETVQVTAFADVEKADRRGFHRTGSGVPSDAESGNTYNWQDTWKDRNYRYGVIVQVPVIEQTLDLTTSYAQEYADGVVDFLAPGSTSATTPPRDIFNMGDYRKNILQAKLTYQVTRALGASLGALWERLRSDDIQYNNYVNNGLAASNGRNQFLLTGAYKDNRYSATTAYLTVSYRF
ncbi:MAG: MtrB/PioB family outer membrane beta-barrel protein [Oligoflexia bacterium]|nr:MtrB/PioB family outer membrane beta-barrel protein [Oligoflexia bacterium]